MCNCNAAPALDDLRIGSWPASELAGPASQPDSHYLRAPGMRADTYKPTIMKAGAPADFQIVIFVHTRADV